MTTAADRPTARPAVILPDHPEYDEARSAWNLAVDQRPAGVVLARSVADVLGAVEIAAEQGLRIAPQTSGHLAAALPDLDGTLLVRTMIGGVDVDPVARRARIGAGAIWQEVLDAIDPHGLAALSGSAHDVGVVGYLLGGGLSWLGRAKGLAANHVLAIEVVTADGRLVRCDADTEPELFWALRGGAGNFGIVTAIEIGLLEIREVVAGMTIWPASAAREVLRAWVAWCRTAPEGATTAFRLLRLPPLPEIPEPLRDTPLVVVDGALLDCDLSVLDPVLGVGTPMMQTWAPMPPAGLVQVHMDPPQPVPGVGDGILLEDLDDATLDALLAAGRPEEVSPLLMVELRQLGGALRRAPDGAGARATLEGAFLVFGVGVPMAPADGAAIHARLDGVLAAVAPAATGTVYVNFSERGGSAAPAFPPTAYERLRDVRAVWDPHERFVASHRIEPRRAETAE